MARLNLLKKAHTIVCGDQCQLLLRVSLTRPSILISLKFSWRRTYEQDQRTSRRHRQIKKQQPGSSEK